MKRLLPIIILSVFVKIQMAQAQTFTVAKKGVAKSVIILPEKPTVTEIQAAKVLQDYIERISGARLSIEGDSVKYKDHEILIGNVNRPQLNDVPKEKLGKDGLFIRTNDNSLVITGGTDKGVLYGVYTFLEKYMGCRKYSSKVTYVPRKKKIVLGAINDMELPAFSYRENFYRDATDLEYQNWHKLDSHV